VVNKIYDNENTNDNKEDLDSIKAQILDSLPAYWSYREERRVRTQPMSQDSVKELDSMEH
jgi:hypothetical protein